MLFFLKKVNWPIQLDRKSNRTYSKVINPNKVTYNKQKYMPKYEGIRYMCIYCKKKMKKSHWVK